ncbi:hypothetical protein Pan216_35190 [Planctomycetes bacterium Pan216]|uniref:Uncharacterized protein n=1 Tax=Kolteria novifilia TaxID=2527975 RepID=A0A518B6T9_9BACT|nr:hypothetical protein Pan216_35190 [Planctomycetes bacterium Pan216]
MLRRVASPPVLSLGLFVWSSIGVISLVNHPSEIDRHSWSAFNGSAPMACMEAADDNCRRCRNVYREVEGVYEYGMNAWCEDSITGKTCAKFHGTFYMTCAEDGAVITCTGEMKFHPFHNCPEPGTDPICSDPNWILNYLCLGSGLVSGGCTFNLYNSVTESAPVSGSCTNFW